LKKKLTQNRTWVGFFIGPGNQRYQTRIAEALWREGASASAQRELLFGQPSSARALFFSFSPSGWR